MGSLFVAAEDKAVRVKEKPKGGPFEAPAKPSADPASENPEPKLDSESQAGSVGINLRNLGGDTDFFLSRWLKQVRMYSPKRDKLDQISQCE